MQRNRRKKSRPLPEVAAVGAEDSGLQRRQPPAGEPPSPSDGKPAGNFNYKRYSTVTLFARLRGWSTSQPRATAMARASICSGTLAVMAENASRTFGM